MSENFWTIVCPWVLSHSIMPEKIGQSLFFTGQVAFFFQKFMFSTTCFPQNWSYYFHSNCHITLWTFIKFSLTFFTFDNTRKARPNYFFHWKVCLFLQKLVFSTDSWLIKKWSYISHQNCQKTSCSLTKIYSMSVKVGNMRKKRPKSFSLKR